MTENNTQRDELKTKVSEIANRFLEIYLGEEKPIELSFGVRMCCALAGTVISLRKV